jgi:large subunit ribosomal protein L9
MDVVLLERIEQLGKMGDVVKVKDGFARNFLLPRKKALRATQENIARFEKERAVLETKSEERKTQAEGLAKTLDGQSYVVIRQAGDSGQLYGSVSPRDIAAAVSAAGLSVARTDVQLANPIKTLGLHMVQIVLHPEVKVSVSVNVARSPEEAERQARGEVIRAGGAEEEEPEVEALFESAEAAARAKGEEPGEEPVPAA